MQMQMEFQPLTGDPKVIEVWECHYRDIDLCFVATNAKTAEYAIKATDRLILGYNSAFAMGVIIKGCKHQEAVDTAWHVYKMRYPVQFYDEMTFIIEYGNMFELSQGLCSRVIEYVLSLEAGASDRQLIGITETARASAAQVGAAKRMLEQRGIAVVNEPEA